VISQYVLYELDKRCVKTRIITTCQSRWQS